MAGNVYGADVVELRSLSERMSRSAADLDRIVNLLTHQITATTAWAGPNAQRFRGDWSVSHRAAVASSSRALRECAAALRRNADDQERTSAADSSSVGPRSKVTMSSPASPGFVDARNAFSMVRGFELPNGMNAWDTATAIGSVKGNPITGAISDIETYGGAAASLAAGEMDIFQAADVVSTSLKKAPPFSVAHVGGMAIGVWTIVGREAMDSDFSASGFQVFVDAIGKDPIGSAEAAVVNIERIMPDMVNALF